MNCEKVLNLLSAYVDRELSPEEQRLVRAHLVGCRDCGAEYDALVALKQHLASLPSVEVPADFFAGVSARLDAEETLLPAPARRGPGASWYRYWPAAAAAVLALAVLVPGIRPVADAQVIDPKSFFRQHSMTSAAQPLADDAVFSYYVASATSTADLSESQIADRVKLIGQPLTP